MANENMIQKHEDNFLAKIAGETPIDDKPRNSTEFWLNEIAENLPGGGTTVIANPTLAGTEDALTGLQVGDTKYSVGEKLYKHNIVIKPSASNNIILFCCCIITNDDTPLTMTNFIKYVYQNGHTERDKILAGTGFYSYGSPAIGEVCLGVYSTSAVFADFVIACVRLDDFSASTVNGSNSQYLSDTVVAI